MKFQRVLALRGPNIWANFPVLEAWVDLEELKDSPSDSLPGFNERLMSWLPTMIEHRCSVGERGGFFERLRRGTWPGHILEHVTLELQSLAGSEVGYGRARETSVEGVYKVVVEYQEEGLARAALETGRELILAAIHDRPFDVAAEVKKLRTLFEQIRLGPSTGSIVKAAVDRGIPVRRLNENSLVQLGHGSKQRRICAAQTDRTGAIAQEIAQDKELTRELLAGAGIPVPTGRIVDDAEDAWEAACEIGVPVVVKPQYGNQGRGVATRLMTREAVIAAYHAAREEGSSILVEKFIPGGDYRLLVVGDRVVAAAHREAARVVGDGQHTVAELVDLVNLDPRRGEDHATSLSKINLDAIALGVLMEQGLAADSIPPAGTMVLIRRNANLSTGGTATDVTDFVHPEIAARAIEAARVVGLDVAGVDVLASDIGRSLEEQGGGIVEVNASPGLRMHLEPSSGLSRQVGEAIVNTMFGPGETGRIPIVAVTGTNGKTTTTRLIAHVLRKLGQTVGMTCTDGIFINDRRIDGGDCSGPQSARAVLANPRVDAAVLETARGGILRAGLGYDRADVAVVTNIGEGDHLGLSDIDTLEKLAKVKRTLVEAVAPNGWAVLKADDPLCAEMAEKCPGGVIFFAQDGSHAVIESARQKGGRAVFVRNQAVIAAEGTLEINLVALERVPLTHQGRIGFQVENVLAACAAAWGLGVPLETIRAGMESFDGDLEKVPGRFNLLEVGGATVVLDYGHNPSALLALLDAIKIFPHTRRTAVYSAAGDRRDCDLIRQGELLGDAFDRVILYEDHYTRGRKDGEIMALFQQGLSGRRRVTESMEITGAIKAVETALSMSQPGDLLVIQPDKIDETLTFIRHYLENQVAGREVKLQEIVGDARIGKPAVRHPAK